jgi:hypothetical protein
VATRPERRSRGQGRRGGRHDAALSFPFGIGTNAPNRACLLRCAVGPDSQFHAEQSHAQLRRVVPVPHREKRNGMVTGAPSCRVTEQGTILPSVDLDRIRVEITIEHILSLLGFQPSNRPWVQR